MKNFLLYIITFTIAMILFLYLSFSFVNKNSEPMAWRPIYRDYFFLSIVTITVIESIYYIKNKTKK